MTRNYKQLLSAATKTRRGKQALKKYRQFWGLPYPVEVTAFDVPGAKKSFRFVSMGRSPRVVLADGPKGRQTRQWSDRKSRVVATDPSGRRIFVLNKKLRGPIGKRLRFVGWAPMTEYIPTVGMERAGSFKAGKYWRHLHLDEGGKWPKVYKDSSGNYIYGPGTYRVGRWIRR
jgi:hypothetical protein